MSNEASLEQRLAAVERAVDELQRQLAAIISTNWPEQLTGSISDEALFLEALEFGRALRQADRPNDDHGDQP